MATARRLNGRMVAGIAARLLGVAVLMDFMAGVDSFLSPASFFPGLSPWLSTFASRPAWPILFWAPSSGNARLAATTVYQISFSARPHSAGNGRLAATSALARFPRHAMRSGISRLRPHACFPLRMGDVEEDKPVAGNGGAESGELGGADEEAPMTPEERAKIWEEADDLKEKMELAVCSPPHPSNVAKSVLISA